MVLLFSFYNIEINNILIVIVDVEEKHVQNPKETLYIELCL